jgi:hypothetical protein
MYEEIFEYDDKGVLCKYTEEDGWIPVEECCENCGYKIEECECKYCRECKRVMKNKN